jgi:hypothetical protein
MSLLPLQGQSLSGMYVCKDKINELAKLQYKSIEHRKTWQASYETNYFGNLWLKLFNQQSQINPTNVFVSIRQDCMGCRDPDENICRDNPTEAKCYWLEFSFNAV